MERCYSCLLSEANDLKNTFTISYEVSNYENDLFSSTYDELSMWIRNALKLIEEKEMNGRESDLYTYMRKFRGKAGNVTLTEFNHILDLLKDKH